MLRIKLFSLYKELNYIQMFSILNVDFNYWLHEIRKNLISLLRNAIIYLMYRSKTKKLSNVKITLKICKFK